MLKAGLLATLVMVAGTIVLGFHRIFNLAASSSNPLQPQLRVPRGSRLLIASPEEKLLHEFTELNLCDGTVFHCPLAPSCVAQLTWEYFNYCSYKGESVKLQQGQAAGLVGFGQAVDDFLQAYQYWPGEEMLYLVEVDTTGGDYVQSLDNLALPSKRGVIAVGENSEALKRARAMGFVAMQAPGHALALELLLKGFVVVHVHTSIPQRAKWQDAKCDGMCDMVQYRDSYQIYSATKDMVSLLTLLVLAKTRLVAADSSELFQALVLKLDLVVHSFPPPGRFAALALCDGTGYYYGCSDNPTCDASDMCHHKKLDVQLEGTRTWRNYWTTKQTRETVLEAVLMRMQLEQGFANPQKRLLVMSFNIGFAHLFANWLCALRGNGVDVQYIQQHTLVLATDQAAIDYVTELGFFAPRLDELDVLKAWTEFDIIEGKAASNFGSGAHKKINLVLKFSLPLDLLHFGYTVLIQDVDLIWTRNVFDLLFDQYCDGDCDAAFIHEKRSFMAWQDAPYVPWLRKRNETDPKYFPSDTTDEDDLEKYSTLYPEANTGMFLLKPRPNVIELLEILLESSRLQQWYSRDQILWNTLLYHLGAPKIAFTLLPAELFVPGKHIRPSYMAKGNPLTTVAQGLVAVHASDTGCFRSKYHRLMDIGHWYFAPMCGEPFHTCESIPACFAPFQLSLQYCRKTDLECLSKLTPKERAAMYE
ncbi:hypothetical protein BASA81_001512 [Batrachochytrium salamandrivorans]|nr:hypothetical protein BASA81_001512 [Batrachochytrium salamandrivorans]